MSVVDDETGAFVKVLEKSRRRGFQIIFDMIIAFLTVFILEIGSTYILLRASAVELTGLDQFIRSGLLIFSVILIVLTLAIIADTWWSIGLFGENKLSLVSTLFISVLVVSVFVAIFANRLFQTGAAGLNSESVAGLYIVSIMFGAVVCTYFMWAGVPHFALSQNLEMALRDLHEQIQKKHSYEFGVNKAIERALEWVKREQLEGGIWGEEHPLLETALVLRTFFDIGLPLSYSWTVTTRGVEEVRAVEHTYYVLIDFVQSMELEPVPEKLIALEAIALYDRSNIDPKHPLFEEWRKKILATSEWDLIQEINKYDPKDDTGTTPIFFHMAMLFRLMEDYEVVKAAVETLGATLNIILERYKSSYQTSKTFDIHPRMIARTYTTLLRLTDERWITPPKDISPELSATNFPNIPEAPSMPEMPDVEGIPEAPTIDTVGIPTPPNTEETSVPDVPSPEITPTQHGTPPSPNVPQQLQQQAMPSIGPGRANMGGTRALLKRIQYPEGYWMNGVISTAEALIVLSDQETPEDFKIKLALNYLISLQSANGSWYNDLRKTLIAIRGLHRINTQIVYPI